MAIPTSVLPSIVALSDRYLTAQYHPRKAVNLLDEALASLPYDTRQLTEEYIAAVIAEKLNIDVNTILMETSEKLPGLLPSLQKNVYGQDDILTDLASVLSTTLIGFADENRPLAAILLVGDPGVGKTETAKALARYWFDGEDRLITADMSRFKHPASVGELADFLTHAVKAKPHSVILLDEIEKAHHEVHHLLLQLLGEGRLTDNRQRHVDFTNTIIILTTNSKSIQDNFGKELHDRLNAVYTYNTLDKTATTQLIDKQLTKFNLILQEKSITVSLSDSALEILTNLSYRKQARGTANIFEQLIKQTLTQGIIQGAIHNDHDYHIDLQYDSNNAIKIEIIADNEFAGGVKTGRYQITGKMAVIRVFVEKAEAAVGIDAQAHVKDIVEATGLDFDDVIRVIGELEQEKLIHVMARKAEAEAGETLVWAKGLLFTKFDHLWKPWNPADDAWEIALSYSHHPDFPTDPKLVAEILNLPPRRLNPAINYLMKHKLVEGHKAKGTYPFTISRMYPNRENIATFLKKS